MTRRSLFHLLLGLPVSASLPAFARAEGDDWPAPPVQPKPKDPRTLRKVTVSFKEMPLRKALAILFKDSKLKVDVYSNVRDVPITLSIRDVPFDTIVRLIVRQADVAISGGVEYRYRSGTYRIFPTVGERREGEL
jgi:hypothetical protein